MEGINLLIFFKNQTPRKYISFCSAATQKPLSLNKLTVLMLGCESSIVDARRISAWGAILQAGLENKNQSE
jgi:hypothetical protein